MIFDAYSPRSNVFDRGLRWDFQLVLLSLILRLTTVRLSRLQGKNAKSLLSFLDVDAPRDFGLLERRILPGFFCDFIQNEFFIITGIIAGI